MSSYNLIDTVIGNAYRGLDRPAFIADDGTISFGELLERSSQCARYLGRHGLQAGQRVAIAYPRPEDNVIALLAAWLLGATPILIDFRTKSAEKATLAEALGVSVFVQAHAGPGARGYLEITTGELIDAIRGEEADLYERPANSHPSVILRTSGTTGTPQGLVYSHEGMLHMLLAKSIYVMGFDRGLLVHATPLFYSAGLVRTLSQLVDGGPSIIMPMISSPEELAERIWSCGAKVAWTVPAQLQGLLELSSGRSHPMFPGVRLVAGGASVSADNALRVWRELTPDISITYGSSLCGAMSTLRGEDMPKKAGTVGRPYAMNRLDICDPQGRPCRSGETGRVRVRSVSNAELILGEQRATADRIVEGWVETGDLGHIDEDGYLVLTGRASDVIIRKGVNVYPREIEAALEAHEHVVEAAVIGVTDANADEEIVAFVTVRSAIEVKDLVAFARARLVADKRPTTILIVDALPRNPAGKILKRELAEGLAARRGAHEKV